MKIAKLLAGLALLFWGWHRERRNPRRHRQARRAARRGADPRTAFLHGRPGRRTHRQCGRTRRVDSEGNGGQDHLSRLRLGRPDPGPSFQQGADLLVADMTPTLPRAMKVAFTKPFMTTGSVVFTVTGQQVRLGEACKPAGTKIAVLLGSTGEKNAQTAFPDADIKSYKGGGRSCSTPSTTARLIAASTTSRRSRGRRPTPSRDVHGHAGNAVEGTARLRHALRLAGPADLDEPLP